MIEFTKQYKKIMKLSPDDLTDKIIQDLIDSANDETELLKIKQFLNLFMGVTLKNVVNMPEVK